MPLSSAVFSAGWELRQFSTQLGFSAKSSDYKPAQPGQVRKCDWVSEGSANVLSRSRLLGDVSSQVGITSRGECAHRSPTGWQAGKMGVQPRGTASRGCLTAPMNALRVGAVATAGGAVEQFCFLAIRARNPADRDQAPLCSRQLIDLGRHDEIVLVQALDLVRVQLDSCSSPTTEADAAVMALRLGKERRSVETRALRSANLKVRRSPRRGGGPRPGRVLSTADPRCAA